MRADSFIRDLGFEAYRVGGSVRDELLGRRPKDADYVVRASLWDLYVRLQEHRAHPTRLTLRNGTHVGYRAETPQGYVEIVLPRAEVTTGPAHGDFEITVDPDLALERDAERRDFTINALYRDLSDGYVRDPLRVGRDDLKERTLRITHPDSFRDDPLRILRCARFAAQLGFDPEGYTYVDMIHHASAVTGLTDKGVSGTALNELEKLLMGLYAAKGLRLLRDTKALEHFLPELKPMIGFEQGSRYHTKTADEHTFDAIECAARVNASLRTRMALLFHDAGKPKSAWKGEDGRLHYYANPDLDKLDHETIGARIAQSALTRLNAPRDLRRDVVALIERHMVSTTGRTKPFKVRKWRAELGDELLRDLLVHRICDVLGKDSDPSNPSDDTIAATVALHRIEKIRQEARAAGVPTSVKELAISGGDLKNLGLEGRAIGEVQRQLLHEVLANTDLNSRQGLISRACSLAGLTYVKGWEGPPSEPADPGRPMPRATVAPRQEAGAEEEVAPDDRPHRDDG